MDENTDNYTSSNEYELSQDSKDSETTSTQPDQSKSSGLTLNEIKVGILQSDLTFNTTFSRWENY